MPGFQFITRWSAPSALTVLSCLLVVVGPATAQDAVVSYNVNLRQDPSSSNPEIRLMLPGAELFLLSQTRTNNYYNVRTMDNVVGWAYAPRVRLLPPPSGPPEVFNSCGLEGNASRPDIQERNRMKNRGTAPQASDIDASITLQAILQPGEDETRFEDSDGATITGFVFDVKAGSTESVNCGATTVQFKDTHIEVTLSSADTDQTRRFIIEVTPKWRAFKAPLEDWSNVGLRNLIEGQCAEFTGWMFWDEHHQGDAENTDPGGGNNWRATAWEIHPVTDIRAVSCT